MVDAGLAAALAASLESAPAAGAADAEERALAAAIAASLGPGPSKDDGALAMDVDSDEELRRALSFSLVPDAGAGGAVAAPKAEHDVSTPAAAAAALRALVFGDAPAAVENQWLRQGIAFAPAAAAAVGSGSIPGSVTPQHSHDIAAGSNPISAAGSDGAVAAPVEFTAGLSQNQGGPCAVLAAVQAFTLRRLLFDPGHGGGVSGGGGGGAAVGYTYTEVGPEEWAIEGWPASLSPTAAEVRSTSGSI